MPTFFFFLSTLLPSHSNYFVSIRFFLELNVPKFTNFPNFSQESQNRSDTSRTIDRKDRKSGKKRAIRERRPSPRPKQKKRASVRFLVSSLLEDATVCPTVCTTCSTRCDWATRANLPSFAYAVIVEDGSARTTSSRRFLRPVCLG